MVSIGGGKGSRWATAAWNAGKILLVYAAAGPLIGLVVFALGISFVTIAGGQPGGIWLAPFFLLYGVVFAHFVGLPWALVAGGAAFVLFESAGRHAWIGLASGAASFAIAAMTGNVALPVGPEGAVFDRFDTAFVGLMACVHVLAAAGCWLAVRPLVRD